MYMFMYFLYMCNTLLPFWHNKNDNNNNCGTVRSQQQASMAEGTFYKNSKPKAEDIAIAAFRISAPSVWNPLPQTVLISNFVCF